MRPLSPRQHQVAIKLASGWTNQEIATALSISTKTVGTHRGHVLQKLGVRSNVELSRFWGDTGRQYEACDSYDQAVRKWRAES